jgi:hypothetical protein
MNSDNIEIFKLYIESAEIPDLPPLQKGERLVYLVSPEGKREIVAFCDKFWDFNGEKFASIGRPLNGGWSHGVAPRGYKIEEFPPQKI